MCTQWLRATSHSAAKTKRPRSLETRKVERQSVCENVDYLVF